MARVLVIGGTLFIGLVLVEKLLARDDDVTIMHRKPGSPFGARVHELHCDRNDTRAVEKTLRGKNFDVVFDNVYDWQRGTSAQQVLAAAQALQPELQRYVFMSSVAVYPGNSSVHEEDALVPADDPNMYGAQKAETERALFALHRSAGFPVTTVRPAFIYGPGNPYPRESFFWDRILAGRPIIIPDDGSRTMQFVHVEDVAEAALRAAAAPHANGRAYHLAGYPPVTQREFVELLARVAGREVELVFVEREVIEAAGGGVMEPPLYFGAYLDVPPITALPGRVSKDLGLELRPLEEGMRQTFEWYVQQPRVRQDFSWEDKLLTRVR